MNKTAKNVLALSLISAIVAILMAITNYITAPIIEKNQTAKQNAALLEVLPDATSFEELTLSAYTLPETVSAAYKANDGGYVVKITTTGYASGLVVMCGVNASGEVVGAKVIANSETPSVAGNAIATYGDALKGATSATIDSIDTVSGATYTSTGYRNAVKDALNAVTVFMGGSVDLRTPEEILNDRMTELLPASEGKFSRHFVAEVLDPSILKVYAADNGEGYVFLLADDKMLAFTKDGTILGDADDAEKQLITLSGVTLKASKATEQDISSLGLPKSVKKLERTESGNYIFTLEAEGFTYNDHYYGPDKYTPIVIRIAMTAEGTILTCDTVSQKESAKYGAACEKDEFTDQLVGRSEDTYREIDGISGATITTDAYLDGIKNAYKALAILTGGNEE